MKPREIFYDGVWYRSTVAAQHAVFLDTLGVGYRYEPQGLEHEGQRYYWPDFLLTALACWLKIEAGRPGPDTEGDGRRLVYATRLPLYVFFGGLELPEDSTRSAHLYHPSFDKKSAEVAVDFDEMYWWCECRLCHSVGIQYQGRSARLPCHCLKRRNPYNDKEYNFDSPRLLRAYSAAATARFGERRFHVEG